jgi:HSP20 family protein
MAIIPFRNVEALPQRLGTLQQEMNDLLSTAFGELPTFSMKPGEFSPKVDISESDNEIIVSAEIPGVSRDDIRIEVDRDVLSLSGEKREERHKEDGGRVIHHEVRHGSFLRRFTLPCEVNADKTQAKMNDGVLTLQLPKKEPSKGKRIAIKG